MRRSWRREVEKLAVEFDRHIVKPKRGHSRLVCNRGERGFVVCGDTPSDLRHALENLRRDLIKSDRGLDIVRR